MSGGVFICYRREDSAGFAGRIYDRLVQGLGRDNVFIDVDNIEPGLDFVEVLSERLGKCDALIALIGRDWISSTVKGDRRRIDDPHDFVRIEIEAALDRSVRLIPVLVDGATMPRREELPDSLQKLRHRQAIEISHNRFDSDVERLTRALSLIQQELRRREEIETVSKAKAWKPKTAKMKVAGTRAQGKRTKATARATSNVKGCCIIKYQNGSEVAQNGVTQKECYDIEISDSTVAATHWQKGPCA
jgi:hypothetical protein